MSEEGSSPDAAGDTGSPEGGEPEGKQPEGTPAGEPEGGKPDGKDGAADGDGTVLTGSEGPQGAPEEYAEFRAPEGIEVNQPLLDAAKPVFKEMGLSQIQAQQLFDTYAGVIKAESQSNVESFDQTMKDWKAEAESDSEYGGENFAANIGAAKRAIDKLGTPALVTLLNDTGLGNHPEVIRLFHRASKLIVEDDPGGGTRATGKDQSQAEILYPDAKTGTGG